VNFRFKTAIAGSNFCLHSFLQLWLSVTTLKLILGRLGRSTLKTFGSTLVLRCTSHGVVMTWRYCLLLKVGRSSTWLMVLMDKWSVCWQVHWVLDIMYRTRSMGGTWTVQLWLLMELYCFGGNFLITKTHPTSKQDDVIYSLWFIIAFCQKREDFSGFWSFPCSFCLAS